MNSFVDISTGPCFHCHDYALTPAVLDSAEGLDCYWMKLVRKTGAIDVAWTRRQLKFDLGFFLSLSIQQYYIWRFIRGYIHIDAYKNAVIITILY